jgi:hypothetical protein
MDVKIKDFGHAVIESLAELDCKLHNAVSESEEVTRLLEDRKVEEANNRLGQLLECVRIFSTYLTKDPGRADPPDAEISRSELSAALERALSRLNSAHEKRCWVSVCDVLEYEITPILDSWRKMVAASREHIR